LSRELKLRRALALSAAALSLSCGAAAAQQSAPALPSDTERKVEVQVSARATYDSNVARGTEAVATVRQLRKDDVLYSPNVRFNALYPVGRQAVFLDLNAGYEFYQYNEVLRRERIAATGGVLAQIGPCGGGLTGGYSRRQSDQEDLDLTVTQNVQQTTSASVQVACSFGAGFGQVAGLQYHNTRNSADRGVVDSETVTATGGLSYRNNAVGLVEVVGSATNSTYNDVDVVQAATMSDFQIYSFGVRLSRPIGTRLTGRASIALTEVQTDAAGGDGYRGLSGAGALSYRVNPRLSTTLSYDRSIVPSIQEGSNYTLATSLRLQGSYRVSSRIRTNLGTSWNNRAYEGDIVFPASQIEEENIHSVFGAVVLTLGRDLLLSLDARHDDRNTNLMIFDYKAYRVGLAATKTF
jgi:hypothetical protein